MSLYTILPLPCVLNGNEGGVVGGGAFAHYCSIVGNRRRAESAVEGVFAKNRCLISAPKSLEVEVKKYLVRIFS